MGYNTIKIKKYSDVIEEYEVVAALSPGHLVEVTSALKVQKHSTAGGNSLPMFALEDELQGKDIDDNYAAGDQAQIWIPGRGDQVYAVLSDGETIAAGDFLESNGDGTLRKHIADTATWDSDDAGTITVEPLKIIAQALEAKDLSGSSGEGSAGESYISPLGYDKRIVVRIV